METARLLLAIFLPPVVVYLEDKKEITWQFYLNLVLCIFCYLPGVVHALVLLLLRVKDETE